MKKCPYCAEEIRDEAIICRYCGRELQGFVEKIDVNPTTIKSNKKRRGVFLPALLFGIGMGILGFMYDIRQPIQYPQFGDSGHFNNAFMGGISNIFIYGGLYSFITWIKRSFIDKDFKAKVFSSQSGFTSMMIFSFGLGMFMWVNIMFMTSTPKEATLAAPILTSTPSVEICFIKVSGQTYQLAFSGKGASAICERIIQTNNLAYSTSSPINEKIQCSAKKQTITVNVRDIDYENESRDGMCKILYQTTDYRSLSASAINSIITANSSNALLNNCTEWSKITSADVGKTMCVYGDIRNSWYSENQGAHIITFSGDPKDIYFIMYGDWTFDGVDGKCASVTGKIERVYDTPVIRIPAGDPIYMCE